MIPLKNAGVKDAKLHPCGTSTAAMFQRFDEEDSPCHDFSVVLSEELSGAMSGLLSRVSSGMTDSR